MNPEPEITTEATTETAETNVETTNQETAQEQEETSSEETISEETSSEGTADSSTEEPKEKVVEEEEKVAGKYPENWRELAAKGDEKKLERLKRFSSPEALVESYIEAEQKLRTKTAPKVLGKDATPEEVAEYREALGIPEKAEDYKIDLGDGYVIGDDMKERVDILKEKMHATNATESQINEALKTYMDIEAAETAEFYQQQEGIKSETIKELREEWGGKYDTYRNVLDGYLRSSFGDDADVILNAVAADGTPIMNNANVLRKFLNVALDNDPVGSVLPSNNDGGISTVENEIKAIESFMATNRPAYFKDHAKQERYAELLEARNKYNKK